MNWTIKMEILMANKIATVYNTIGILHGREEPDRYLLVGNRRDACILVLLIHLAELRLDGDDQSFRKSET